MSFTRLRNFHANPAAMNTPRHLPTPTAPRGHFSHLASAELGTLAEAAIFDGRDNEEIKLKFFAALTGETFEIVLLP